MCFLCIFLWLIPSFCHHTSSCSILLFITSNYSKTTMQATPRLSEDKVKQCVDPKLNNEYPPKAVAKMAAVAALCVQYEADFRPNMTIVVKALQPLLNQRPAGPESQT